MSEKKRPAALPEETTQDPVIAGSAIDDMDTVSPEDIPVPDTGLPEEDSAAKEAGESAESTLPDKEDCPGAAAGETVESAEDALLDEEDFPVTGSGTVNRIDQAKNGAGEISEGQATEGIRVPLRPVPNGVGGSPDEDLFPDDQDDSWRIEGLHFKGSSSGFDPDAEAPRDFAREPDETGNVSDRQDDDITEEALAFRLERLEDREERTKRILRIVEIAILGVAVVALFLAILSSFRKPPVYDVNLTIGAPAEQTQAAPAQMESVAQDMETPAVGTPKAQEAPVSEQPPAATTPPAQELVPGSAGQDSVDEGWREMPEETYAAPGAAYPATGEEYPAPGSACIGITCRDVPNAYSLGMTPIGVEITGVEPESAAFVAGLRAGDIITSIDGAQIPNMERLRSVMGRYQPGDYAVLGVRCWVNGTTYVMQELPIVFGK